MIVFSEQEVSEESVIRDALSAYLKDAHASTASLTPEEEYALYGLASCGDTSAINAICANNLLLVVSIAKQFKNRGMPFSDLISVGNLGLLHAISHFDSTRGTKLSTFATPSIQGYIQTEIMNKGRQVRVPAQKLKDAARAKRAGDSSLVDALPEPVFDGEEQLALLEAEGVYTQEYQLGQDENSALLEHFLARLTEQERFVLEHRYGMNGRDEKTLQELGAYLQLSHEAVRLIQQRALGKVYKAMDHDGIQKEDVL